MYIKLFFENNNFYLFIAYGKLNDFAAMYRVRHFRAQPRRVALQNFEVRKVTVCVARHFHRSQRAKRRPRQLSGRKIQIFVENCALRLVANAQINARHTVVYCKGYCRLL